MLYKYRNFNTNNLEALKKNCFWGASVKSLNDIFEGEFKKDKSDRFINRLYRFFPKQSNEIERINSSQENLISRVINQSGVYSLSLNELDDKMWALYGDSHKGFCIEFDSDKLLNSPITSEYFHFKVKYQKKISSLNIHFARNVSNNTYKILKEIIGIKNTKWEYENEYRIITDNIGLNQYPPEAIKSIIFGLKSTPEDKEKMFNILKGRAISYYQIEKDYTQDFKLLKRKIDSPNIDNDSYLKFYLFNKSNQGVEFSYDLKEFDSLRSKAKIIINLQRKVSKEELTELSYYLRENLIPTIKNYCIFYYYEEQINRDIVWANCIANRNNTHIVNINDFM